jgi:hypothetical protein
MSLKFSLSAIFGLVFLPVASMPVAAHLASTTKTTTVAAETKVIQLADARKKKGAHKGGASHNVKANKNVNVKRSGKVNKNVGGKHNVNVKKNVDVNVKKNVNVNVKHGLYTGRHVYTGGTWVRPGGYWWPVGGAVAAGAALGFVTAATAAAWAGASPGPAYCWYYTDSSRQQGFWDSCP